MYAQDYYRTTRVCRSISHKAIWSMIVALLLTIPGCSSTPAEAIDTNAKIATDAVAVTFDVGTGKIASGYASNGAA